MSGLRRRRNICALHAPILYDDLALAAGGYPRCDGLKALRRQPAAEIGQRPQVHLLQLVQQHKAAFRVELAHDGRCHAQLVGTRHIAPALALISERAVIHGKSRQREVGAVQKGAAFLPLGMRNLGEVFDSLAYEYKLTQAIREGYLCPILAQTIPLQLDISQVALSGGDFAVGGLGTALDPYLEQIASEMQTACAGRKTVVFLPLIKTSQKFRDILNSKGFRAAEVNGQSEDRAEILSDFSNGKYNVLCNSMLLTEGWDCPSVDCIVVLRPTKVRSLYSQMVGRGTRLSPETGKKDLLLLDFLWLTERHELCRPADIICENREVSRKMTENLAQAGCPEDIEQAAEQASADVVAQREEALAKQLAEMRRRKKKLVDPLQYEMSIQAEDLTGYVPSFGWEMGPPSEKQTAALEKFGILPDAVESAGKAQMLLDRLNKRRGAGLTTPKQIRCLEKYGFQHVGTWQFSDAKYMIDRIAANGWRVPQAITPTG